MFVLPFCTNRRAALSPDGKTLAIGPDFPEGFRTEDGGVPVRLWDVATGKAGPELDKPAKVVDVPDEEGSRRTERPRGRSTGHEVDGRSGLLSGRAVPRRLGGEPVRAQPDRPRICLGCGDGPGGRDPRCRPAARGGKRGVRADGRTLATASADGTVRLWEVATWKVRAEFRGHRDRVTALAFGPDGRLFTGGLDTVVLGWDVQPPRGTASRP